MRCVASLKSAIAVTLKTDTLRPRVDRKEPNDIGSGKELGIGWGLLHVFDEFRNRCRCASRNGSGRVSIGLCGGTGRLGSGIFREFLGVLLFVEGVLLAFSAESASGLVFVPPPGRG